MSGEALVLRPLAITDLNELSSWFGEERAIVQWGGPGVRYPLNAPQLRRMIAEGEDAFPKRRCWMALEGERVVGHAQLAFDWRNGNATLCRVAVAPAARGRGIARSMLSRVLDEAFGLPTPDAPAIERVELNVFAWNEAAIRTYRALGFVHEGTRRSAAQVGNERWDTSMMGLLQAEWSATGSIGPRASGEAAHTPLTSVDRRDGP